MHEGRPPCKACSDNESRKSVCQLSFPEGKGSGKVSKPEAKTSNNGKVAPKKTIIVLHNEHLTSPDHPAGTLSPKKLRHILLSIKKWFPELFFLHLPSLTFPNQDNYILMNSVVALYALSTEDSSLESADVYYQFVVEKVIGPLLLGDVPIESSQALIILSLLQWGRAQVQSSYMLSGMAIGMMRNFDRILADEAAESLFNKELCVRLFWACFVVERIATRGRGRFLSVPTVKLSSLPLPSSEEQYLYMNASLPASGSISTLQDYEGLTMSTENHSAAFLVILYDIWGQIMTFLHDGGRTVHKQPPWSEDSPVHKITFQLERFYASLPEYWKWSLEKFNVHSIRGTETDYLMVNCIYCLCFIYLTREYTPFFPHSNSTPVGPTEHPFLPQAPTPDYWEKNSIVMFGNARTLITIIRSMAYLEATSCVIRSPFFNYCIYTALITGLYGKSFYWMDPEYVTFTGDPNNDFNITTDDAIGILKRQDSPLSGYFLSTALLVGELYDAISKNRDRASQLNLGRNSLSNLEEAIQITKTGTNHEESRQLIEKINDRGAQDVDLILGMELMTQDQIEFLTSLMKDITGVDGID